MLCAAQIYHPQPHNLIAQARSFDPATNHFTYLEAVPLDLHVEISGRGFFCLLKEALNG
jgi:hypothetical protein